MSNTGQRILCAEVQQDTCRMLSALLEERGYEVVTAQSASHCLDLARAETFDLFVLQDQSGNRAPIELCRSLRSARPETPILFFSEFAMSDDARNAIDADAFACITNSDDVFEIVKAINSILLPTQPSTRFLDSGRLDAVQRGD